MPDNDKGDKNMMKSSRFSEQVVAQNHKIQGRNNVFLDSKLYLN